MVCAQGTLGNYDMLCSIFHKANQYNEINYEHQL